MRQLRLVHRSDDGSTLLLESTDGRERFGLPVDAVLRSTVRAEPPRPHPAKAATPQPEPGEAVTIGPREIQVRVRSGESPQSLADAYNMSLERVLRFGAAVVDERRRITDEARRARARRTATDGHVVVFGEAVDERFAAHGIAAPSVGWDSRRREDGEWLVIARWPGEEDEHCAEWIFHRSSRTVTPVDEAAADLLSDRPIRPVSAPERESPRPALGPGVFVFPPMPDAATGPLPVIEDVFDQEAPPEGPRIVPPLVPARAGLAAAEPAPPERILNFEEPPLPLGVIDTSAQPATDSAPDNAATRRAARARRGGSADSRPQVPAWDDIMLGVRRQSD